MSLPVNPPAFPQNPSIGEFLGNAANDVGNMVQGVMKLPAAIGTAIQSPQNAIDFGKNLVGGVVKEYNDTLGNPIKNFNPIGFNNPVSMGEAALKHAYEHPVNTIADIAPIGVISKIGKAGDVGEAGEAIDALRTPPKVSNVAADTYMKSYTVPTGLKVNPQNTAKWIINDSPNLKNIDSFHNTIEQIKRGVLGDAAQQGTQININDASTIANKGLDAIPQLRDNPKQILGYKQEINAMMPNLQTTNSLTPGTAKIGGANPLDTYDAIKNIETQGYAYRNASRDAYGNVRDVSLDKVSKVYLDTASQLEQELDKSVGTENVKVYTQNPQFISSMENLSPQVAARFKNNVNDFSDLRALQKPYVDMSKIIDYTNKAGHTAFANLTGGATGTMAAGAGALVGGALGGPIGAGIGAVGGRILEPAIGEIGNKILPPITNMVANNLNKVEKLGTGAKLVPPFLSSLSTSENQGINNEANGQVQQPIHNNIIAPTVKLDEKGHYTLPQPDPNAKPLTPGTPDYTRAQNALPGDTHKFMTNAPQYANIINAVADDTKTMPLDILHHFKNNQELNAYMSTPGNPYASQLADVSALNATFTGAYKLVNGASPDANQVLNPGDSAEQFKEKYNAMIKFVDDNYKLFNTPFQQTTETPQNQNLNQQPPDWSSIKQVAPPSLPNIPPAFPQ